VIAAFSGSKMLSDERHVLVAPTQRAYGKSNEHLASLGTISFPAYALLEVLTEIAPSDTSAGLRKIMPLNSHGGNTDVLDIVACGLWMLGGLSAVATAASPASGRGIHHACARHDRI
jgi:creatinine amidohydrolase